MQRFSHNPNNNASTGNLSHMSSSVVIAENAPYGGLLLNVLRDKRASPISLKDFQAYLDSERCGELSKFFGEAEQHQTVAESKQPVAVKLAHEITDHYIKSEATEEINLSDKDRTKILGRLNEDETEAAYDPALFADAKKEVLTMLSGDKFQRFLKKQLETNITDKEANRRFMASAALTLLSCAIVGLLMWIQTFAEYPFNNRGWRVLVLPLVFWACALYLSSQAKVCNGLAGKCVRMKEGDSWFTAFNKGHGIQQVKDDLALSTLVSKAKQITRKTWIATLVIMAVILLIPPGYGVAAPN
jgi:hypothetical protein